MCESLKVEGYLWPFAFGDAFGKCLKDQSLNDGEDNSAFISFSASQHTRKCFYKRFISHKMKGLVVWENDFE